MYTDWFEILDKRFERLILDNVHVDRLFTGMRWAEGPAYFPAGKYLLFSDIPNDIVHRWDENDGRVTVFSRGGHHNGRTIDHEGRMLVCEHSGRCLSRVEHDGSKRVLASHFEGRRFNSPNDAVVKSDGSIWFTDPSYGIESEYEGAVAPNEIGGCFVFRLDPDLVRLTAVIKSMVRPNGLAFSLDETKLYVADSGFRDKPEGPPHLLSFDLSDDGKTVSQSPKVFADCVKGVFDGFRIDSSGNIWTSAVDGVRCYAHDGTLIGLIRIPEVVANVTFGGIKRNRLFICATTSLFAVYLKTQGAPLKRVLD
ncbi:SMP-30/gluconolactonase/LRE family protein [Rhizobium sp. NLR17b]|uniref:SMP-30/gluconolactonase/LRE family protein n=1 Tax=Rhizobium sp. NLR17b TaxID=2731114 RepID=UPI001C82B7F1|nr:SMP-30/gluconolactonase/LRE family protein [Rhizobium sp. NLR17b]MBX5272667.1 SMP-30/gluconolactonase/LRE family protein [Rhizobium sp. NLR17b]